MKPNKKVFFISLQLLAVFIVFFTGVSPSVALSPPRPVVVEWGSPGAGAVEVPNLEGFKRVGAMALSPNGEQLALGSFQGLFTADPMTGNQTGFHQDSKKVGAVAYSIDSRYLAAGSSAGSNDSLITVRNAASGEKVREFTRGARARALAFSPDNKTLLAGYGDGLAVLWEVETGTRLIEIELAGAVSGACFIGDGSTVAMGWGNEKKKRGGVDIYTSSGGKLLKTLIHPGPVGSMVCGGAGVLTGWVDPDSGKGGFKLWDGDTGELVQSIDLEHAPTALAFSSDLAVVATGSQDGFANLWDLSTATMIQEFEVGDRVSAVVFLPGDRAVAVGTGNSKTKVFRTISMAQALFESGVEPGFPLLSKVIEKRYRRALENNMSAMPETLFKGAKNPDELVKDEFETLAEFNERVAGARAWLEINGRIPDEVVKEILLQTFTEVFGAPRLENLKYDADVELFFADLTSDGVYAGEFKKVVAIAVPRKSAREAKELLGSGRVSVAMHFFGGTLQKTEIKIDTEGGTFEAREVEGGAQPTVVVALLDPGVTGTGVDLSLHAGEGAEAREIRAQIKKLRKKKEQEARLVALRSELELLKDESEEWSPTRETLALIEKLPNTGRSNPNGLALIFGNRNYSTHHSEMPDVKYAANDAEAAHAIALKTLGIPEDNIHLFINAPQSRFISWLGTSENHRGRLADLSEGGKTDLFLFYSGHGAPGLGDGKGYLVPVNADPKKLELTGYPLDLLFANLGKLRLRSVRVVIDACFSGSSDAGAVITGASPALFKVVDPAINLQRGMVIRAAGSAEVASWDHELRLGILTRALVEGLSGAADSDGDGSVSTGEVSNYLEREVSRKARRVHGRDQNPQVVGPADMTF